MGLLPAVNVRLGGIDGNAKGRLNGLAAPGRQLVNASVSFPCIEDTEQPLILQLLEKQPDIPKLDSRANLTGSRTDLGRGHWFAEGSRHG